MNRLLLILVFINSELKSFSQTKSKIQEIDSVVNQIDSKKAFSEIEGIDTLYDGFICRGREMGVFVKYRLFYDSNSKLLDKAYTYSNRCVYYFSNNKLIKVVAGKKGRKYYGVYYFDNEKCIFYNAKQKEDCFPEYMSGQSRSLIDKLKKFVQ